MNRSLARWISAAALCCAVFGAAGCKSLKIPFTSKVPKAVPLKFPKTNTSDGTKRQPKAVGVVLLVNADGGFVLIETHGFAQPDAGTALKTMRGEQETGILAVGEERRGTHLTADIVSGEPRKGDQVFQ